MKLAESFFKHAAIGYLYANGKLVIVHRQPHKHADTVEWITIHDASSINRHFTGRIVLHNRGVVRLMTLARRVRAQTPKVEHGSTNTQRLGIPYGYVSVALGAGDEYSDSVHFGLFETLMGSDLTYQPEKDWIDPENPERWGGTRIAANYATSTQGPANGTV